MHKIQKNNTVNKFDKTTLFALEIFLSMRYINLHFTYLLTYLLT